MRWSLVKEKTEKLLALLEGLEKKFGPLPGILAARADFLDDPEEATRLLERLGERPRAHRSAQAA